MTSATAPDRSILFRIRALPRTILLSRACFALLVVAGILIGTVCFFLALHWIDRPFAGFLINQRMVINGMGQYHWSGTQAGLKHPDKILAANGHPLRTSKDLEQVITSVPVGTPVHYTVMQGGRVEELDVPTMRFTTGDFAVLVGTLFFAGLAYLVLGIVVFVLKPDTAVSWSHFLLCLALGAFNVTAFDVAATHAGLVRWYFFFTVLVPASGVHLSMLFPHPWPIVQRHLWLQALPYLAGAAIVIPMEVGYPGPVFLAVYNFAYVYLVVGALSLLGSSLAAYVWQTSVIARQRSKVVLFGAALAFPLPAFGELAFYRGLTFQGLPVQANFLAIPLLFFPAAIAYAISKHNLFDVDVYIKRTVGYVVMTVIVGSGYFVLEALVQSYVLRPVLGSSAEKAYPIVFALLMVFFFDPINQRVKQGIEALFFRKTYDYKRTVATVSEAITSLTDLDAMLQHVIRTVSKDLAIDRAGVVLMDDQKQECRTLFLGESESPLARTEPDLCMTVDDPLLTLLAKERKLITKYDVAEDPHYAFATASCGPRFADLGASLTFPLFSQERFTGMLALGYKKSGHFYTREDIDLLKTVSAMASTAIEQAREKDQRATLMKLFSKHVSPEVAEALWEQREHFLDGGRPRSQKLTITAMFTDLQGFSTISENQSPEVLMGWLNTYLEMMTTTVMEYGGVVDDFFGDGIKINFGVPIPRESVEAIGHDAINAVNCALAMEERMIRLNEQAARQGQPSLRMRIGITTGPVVAGSLGSADRMKYTTLGDTVNTAARLESFSKEVDLPELAGRPCRILIGESTWRHVDEHFRTVRVGDLALKGKQQTIATYCVLGRVTEMPAGSTVVSLEGPGPLARPQVTPHRRR